jgi:hypothetical protein
MATRTNITRHFLRLPLMWVMLLWAFTLPGHEVAVYTFLLTGSGSAVVAAHPVNDETSTLQVKAQAVTAFPDARPATNSVLPVLQKAGPAFSSFLTDFFFPAADLALPRQVPVLAGAGLLALLLPFSLQPNAP